MIDVDTILELQQKLQHVHVSDELRGYIVDLARHSRQHPDVALGASPRAALYLMHAARARATLQGRAYATHEDVLELLEPVLGHRLILRPEAEIEGRQIGAVLGEVARRVPVSPNPLDSEA
jgi:MoxR-like ATPase